MFAVIYSFEVKPGYEDQLINSWSDLTRLIYQYEGSLGSRLHHHKENRYIAYAQWPSRERWEQFGDQLPKQAKELSSQMHAACQSIETPYELNPVSDLIEQKPFNHQF